MHTINHNLVSRDDVKPLVNRIPHNCHQGFESRYEAERAYVLAFAMGCVRIRTADCNANPSPAAPIPRALVDAFELVSDDFLGAEWHVVFKGRQPGVYPAWYIVSVFIRASIPANVVSC